MVLRAQHLDHGFRTREFFFPPSLPHRLSRLSPRLFHTESNFLSWKQHIEHVIKSHRLHHFLVNPEITMQYLTEVDHEAGIINSEFLR
ncbi:hypothetical protein Fmac_026898 [Flemingia macrophylla]|uniref:Retrotransposon Copia-like N-terminal domain-containing protein n=1 Tax=Flemingia macrophylla TaxID=520843 RepID=A0ABD1LG68_9FABA